MTYLINSDMIMYVSFKYLKGIYYIWRKKRVNFILFSRIGADVRFRRIGKEIIYTGDHIPLEASDELELPDVVVGSLGSDVTKRTLLIYGHVDVKPVHENEQWSHDPFDLQVQGDYLFGRGVTDDKGPLLGWINAIEAFQVDIHGQTEHLFLC